MLPALPRAAHAWGDVLRLRFDGDNNVLDPAYMTGGVEIETQLQCLPFLAEYTHDGDSFGWKPTYFVKKLELREPPISTSNWSTGWSGRTAMAR